MADWTAEVFENEYLATDATDVHAIVSVTCKNAGTAGQSGDAAEIIIVDVSGSMSQPHAKITAARQAAAEAIDEIVDGTWFSVVAGNHQAMMVYPQRGGMVRATSATREEAQSAVRRVEPSGGTAIGSWLRAATQLFASVAAEQCHAILLTDGRDETEAPGELQAAIANATGKFQCDCRGVGADWEVNELRAISEALLGSVDIIAEPAKMEADFKQMMQTAMSRGVANATLRVWAPQGSEVLFAEQLAARMQLIVNDEVMAQGLVRATWSDDATLTTRINPAVAHYTGQAELADAIQEGLAAKAAGDDATATLKLGRAAKLAAQTGDDDATNKLKRVVDIDDVDTGTVRLKRDVSKLDEMALDTSSTKTTRVKR